MTTVDLIEAPVVGLSFGLDLLDSAGAFVADITTDLVGDGSTVARRADNTIHGTCQLVIARQLLWGSARVRPWVEVSAEGETTTRWNLGVYALMTPARNAGEVPETFTVTGYDLLSHLNTPYGSTFAAAVSAVPLTLIATMLTGSNGEYNFNNLPPGDYYIEFVPPVGYIYSPTDKAGNEVTDSDMDHGTGRTPIVSMPPGSTTPNLDAGFYLPPTADDETDEPANVKEVYLPVIER